MDYNLLKQLCEAHGVSGFEEGVMTLIREHIEPFCDGLEYDRCGNLIAFKKGSQGSTGKRILYSCHADEVGFVINHIDKDGSLFFDEIGMLSRVFVGRRVLIGKNKIPGIISTKPIHILDAEERNKEPITEKMYIDIGSNSKEQSQKLSVFGEYAVFDSGFEYFGDGLVKAKALDDRVGCACLISLLKRGLKHDSYFAFCMGEELGLKGSAAVARRLRPQLCINLECTTAGDIFGTSPEKRVCSVGKGPVIPFMDNSAIYAPSLFRAANELAKAKGFAVQTKSAVAGGTDAGNYTKLGCGVIGLAVATRYIHSALSVASKKDIDDTLSLLYVLSDNADKLCEINEGRFLNSNE